MGKSGFRSRRLVNAPATASAPIAPPPEAIAPLDSLVPVAVSWPGRVGDRLARAGDWAAAARAYAAALASYPQEARSAIALGEVELRRDRPEAALAAFTQALAGTPHNLAALLGASRAQEQLGDLAAAGELAQTAWLQHPDRPEPTRRLAALDQAAGRPFDAADSWQGRLADHWLWDLATQLDRADCLVRLDSDPDQLFAAQVDSGSLWHWRGAIGVFDAADRLVVDLSAGNLPQWLRQQPPLPPATCTLSGRVVELDRHGLIQIATAIVPRRFNGPSGYGLQTIRDRWGKLDGDQATQRWVLWPSASGAQRWLNGDELLDHLAVWGFERLDPDALSFEQLLSAFQGAEAIVGPADPVLALVACCPPGCSVLELGSRRYGPLAQLTGATYHSIPGEAPADGRSPQGELWVRSAEVRAVLARCLKRGLRVVPDRPTTGKRPKKMGAMHSHSPDFRDLRD